MSHINIEIAYDSRQINVGRTSMDEEFVFRICIDEAIAAVANHAEIFGMDDDVIALEAAYSIFPLVRLLPSYWGGTKVLVLSEIKVKQIGKKDWEARAKYQYDRNTGAGGEEEEFKISVTIGGGTKHIVKSLANDGGQVRLLSVTPNPDNTEAIGVTEDSIEGYDVPDGTLKVQITGFFDPDFVTLDYFGTLADLISGTHRTGTYNGNIFMGRQIGEVQLTDVSGGAEIVDNIPLTFSFNVARNVINQPDPGFAPITMLAFDVVDYRFRKALDNGSKKQVMEPFARIIHRVHSPADYRLTGLPL